VIDVVYLFGAERLFENVPPLPEAVWIWYNILETKATFKAKITTEEAL